MSSDHDDLISRHYDPNDPYQQDCYRLRIIAYHLRQRNRDLKDRLAVATGELQDECGDTRALQRQVRDLQRQVDSHQAENTALRQAQPVEAARLHLRLTASNEQFRPHIAQAGAHLAAAFSAIGQAVDIANEDRTYLRDTHRPEYVAALVAAGDFPDPNQAEGPEAVTSGGDDEIVEDTLTEV